MKIMEEIRAKMKHNCCFLPRIAFRYVGISFNLNESNVYKAYSMFMILVLNLYPWSNMHLVLHNLDKFEVMINGMFSWLGGYAAVLKVAVMVYKRKNVKAILTKVEEMQEKYNTEEWSQKEVYNTNKKILASIIIFFSALLYFHVGSLVGRLLNDNSQEWTTPVAQVTVINITYSPNYEIAWLFQVFATTSAASAFCMTDFLIIAIIIDITIQFKILAHRINQMFNHSPINIVKRDNNQLDELTWKCLKENIKEIVIHHLNLINLISDLESISSSIILFEVAANLYMICFSVYCASMLPPLGFSAIQAYIEILVIPATLFILCYYGTEISLASESIATACYEINFIGLDVRFQKSLILIIVRSQKSVKLTVGKFVNLSTSVFVWILRSSYSYLMVLRKHNQNQY